MTQTTAQDIAMPRLSDSMEEGTILTWMKQVGDEVAVGEEIAEIETDKANMAYEADVAGTLLEIVVAEGETAEVGAVIARVGDPDAAPASSETPTAPEAEPAAEPEAEDRSPVVSDTTTTGEAGAEAAPAA